MMPVGSDRPVKLDIRIIASTNKDLKKLVARGKFRQDLYYRISVVSINIPPLRERREDIVQLVKHFIGQFNVKYGLNKRISAKAQKLFLNYDWPGNVRELENMVECLIAVTEDDLITESDARLYINGESALRPGSRSKDIEITGSMEEMVGEYESHLLNGSKRRADCRWMTYYGNALCWFPADFPDPAKMTPQKRAPKDRKRTKTPSAQPVIS